MLRHTWDRARQIVSPDRVLTVITAGQECYLGEEASGGVIGQVVVQPANKETGPGLLLPLLWYPVGSLTIWPDYLAYFNELAGGADNGYRYLVDSNLDWGQDLKGLKRFMDDRGIDRIYLSYFGTDSPARYGIQYDWLPSYELENPDPSKTAIDLKRQRYLAISVTNLQGVYMEPNTMYRWLDRYTPVAKIGYSIFVYYLE